MLVYWLSSCTGLSALSPPLPRGLSGILCSPPQYDPFSSPNKSNARCAFVCFLVLEILSATNVQQRDRSELKISGARAGAPIADVGFGARVDWLSTDVALPLVAILCGENQQLPSACQHDDRPPLNVLSSVLSVDVGGVFGDSRTCLAIALFASRRLLPPSGTPRGHIWQCVPRSKVCVCVCVRACVRACACVGKCACVGLAPCMHVMYSKMSVIQTYWSIPPPPAAVWTTGLYLWCIINSAPVLCMTSCTQHMRTGDSFGVTHSTRSRGMRKTDIPPYCSQPRLSTHVCITIRIRGWSEVAELYGAQHAIYFRSQQVFAVLHGY